jgi:hypothetical protein
MRSSKWLKNANFASWWYSWEDLQWPNVKIKDKWKRKAEIFSSSGINAVVAFGLHFRWDFVNYFTRHKEMLKDIIEICHEHDIKVVEHHSAVFNHRAHNNEEREHIATLQNDHLPLYPDSWENQTYKGMKMSDWRMFSHETGSPVFLKSYLAEVFCPNNPGFQEGYNTYIKELFADAEIDALMSDDVAFVPDMYACGCKHCLDKFYEKTGEKLPGASVKEFWYNYDNSLFQEWIKMRFESTSRHYERVNSVLPENIPLWGCSCSDMMPHRISQGASYEDWVNYCDAVFVEIYHKLDPQKDRARCVADIAAASSLAKYNNKELIVICYGRSIQDFEKWGEILKDFNARPWFCRMARDKNVLLEEELFKNGFPFLKNISNSDNKIAVAYSMNLRRKLGHLDNVYFEEFAQTCDKLWEEQGSFDVIFDKHCLVENSLKYEKIYAPKLDALDPSMIEYLNKSNSKISS